MADLAELDRAEVVKITGANPSTGLANNYVNSDINGNLNVIDYATSLTGSAVPTAASYIAGKNQSGNLVGLNLDSSGNLFSLPLPTGAATSANQTTEITSLQLIDNIIGPVIPGVVATGSALIGGQFNTTLPTLTTTEQSALQIDASGRLIIRPLTTADIVTSNQGIPNTVANAWPTKITDGTDTAQISANGDLQVVDGLQDGGVYGALTIPTAGTSVEAKVGASRLTNRKFLQIVTNTAGLFYGLSSAVTTTSGTPIANGQILQFSIKPGSTFQIWLVSASNNRSVQIIEAP